MDDVFDGNTLICSDPPSTLNQYLDEINDGIDETLGDLEIVTPEAHRDIVDVVFLDVSVAEAERLVSLLKREKGWEKVVRRLNAGLGRDKKYD